jgi:hypothetical protein
MFRRGVGPLCGKIQEGKGVHMMIGLQVLGVKGTSTGFGCWKLVV